MSNNTNDLAVYQEVGWVGVCYCDVGGVLGGDGAEGYCVLF